MVYQTVVVGGCGGAGAGGDGKDDRNKRPIRKAGGRHNQRARLTCPRCHSTNTKFCYFNNYSLSQPRHFCKGCRRFWTQGGTLRNVPVGGNHRQRGKRAREESEAVSATTTSAFTNHHHSAVSLPPQPLTLPTQTVVVPQQPVVFFDNGIVLGDLLNVDNGVLAPPPPPPPQPEMDNNHDTYVQDNNGEHYIFEWGNYMGTSGFNA